MSYLEELLPEFRKGAKIRRKDWDKGKYIVCNGTFVYNDLGRIHSLTNSDITGNVWEFYQESIDWQYIIDHNCLCLFWDDDIDDFIHGRLVKISEPAVQFQDYKYKWALNGKYWKNCRPVRRDEVTFYEEKNNED